MHLNPTTEYRGKVRANDPNTSWEAASAQTPERVSRTKKAILLLLADGPRTDDELSAAYSRLSTVEQDYKPVTPQAIRTSRHALEQAGLVTANPEPGRSMYGNPSTRWELNNKAPETVAAVSGGNNQNHISQIRKQS